MMGDNKDRATQNDTNYVDVFLYDTKPKYFAYLITCYSLSLVSLILIFITFIAFKSWRSKLSNRILINIATCMVVNITLLFCDFMAYFDDIQHPYCIINSTLTYYSMVSRWCWTWVLSVLQLVRLNTVLGARNTSNLLLKVSLFSWGLPLVPTIYRMVWEWNNEWKYCLYRFLIYGNEIVFLTTVTGLLSLIILMNVIIFLIIVFKLFSVCCCSSQEQLQRHGISGRKLILRRLRTIVLLFFTFEFSWSLDLFVQFTHENSVLVIVDECLILCQGVILFLFFVVFNESTRELWKNWVINKCLKARRGLALMRVKSSADISVIFSSQVDNSKKHGFENEVVPKNTIII